MAVVKMMGVSLLGPREEIESVAAELLSIGNFEPVPLRFALGGRSRALAGVAASGGNPYDGLLDSLDSVFELVPGESPPDVEATLSGDGLSSLSLEDATERVRSIQAMLAQWKERSEAVAERTEELTAAKAFLDELTAVGREAEQALKPRFLSITLGRLTSEGFKQLEEMGDVTPILAFPLVAEKRHVLAVVFCPSGYRPEARKLFNSVHMTEYDLEELFAGAGESLRERLKEETAALSREARELSEAPRNYLEMHRAELERLYRDVFTMQRVYTLCRERGEIGPLFVLSGVVPAYTLPRLANTLERLGANTILITESDAELEGRGLTLPTLLKNNFFVRKFHEIVAMYSLPSYGETDPSAMVALSFCLFFGFMFGDVGHGLLLVAGAWLMERKGLMKRAFASVIGLAGASSVLFGFLFGSVFGSEEVLPPIWTSPMHGIDNLIQTSLVAGVLFMSLGVVINILTLWRRGRLGKMLFDGEGVAGLLFYWMAAAAGVIAFTSESGVPSFIPAILGVLFIVIMSGGALERLIFGPQEGAGGAAVQTFSALHSLLSFLSNTASFVRLAAFALNHAGLSAAVFMLSDLVHSLPGGALFRAAVLLAGNAVIVGLEGLIVFIQTLRLEYYEFFGKFYHGGGTPFRPVTWRGE